ncbi:glycosyl hydrolases family 18-domain-containing protein [Annulohypoxylon maeteangense]|uniref:glycosyl hydrolases family 18-domain-containing protein n=1 Tax=Annulohypoxylon maeteangense TaxID=1927788 RepID=UPI0020074D7A|nr:glycosyl hydrolases family 18-domain-containing protein [Annulohypoxylon maeteangense]KAI0888397.1 glycosyl hydrolases family 18-domain-containing protein [Annulohypoxylon maeteangense]
MAAKFFKAALLGVVLSAVAVASPIDGSSPNPNLSLVSRALPIGTCNPNTPCPNGACCGSNGLCGYSPAECGTGCTSNCDAKAACGQYGKPGQQKCPLNVCCSEFGFCGSTSDFCGKGCQTGFGTCGDAPKPSCSSSGVNKRTIGYYESWASTRKCQSVQPEDLNLAGFTHVNFAFAFFDPDTFQISPMDSNSATLYHRFTDLKQTYSGLQTWISVGGWSFTDPGPTRQAFSNMASSAANRQKFISGVLSFMNTYGFDGLDIDWEYPGADDRGGVPADTDNFVTLVKELKQGLGSKGLTVTLPTSYWYLQHFDVNAMQDYVDWFNLMSYDLHGTWDADSQFVGAYIAPHTNLTEIDLGLGLLWRAGVASSKVVLGQGWYGRSFTLKDPSCNTPNGVCQFSGGADAGPCSATSGILDYQEIVDIIDQHSLKPSWDKTAGVKWITWDSNQWVSYDDDDTFAQKKSFANDRCLGGMMVWAIDQKDQSSSNNLVSGVTKDQQNNAKQSSADQAGKLSCYTTDCNAKCKKGTNQVTQMNGQPGQLSTSGRCPKGQYRNLCCNDGTTMGKCQWRGYRGVGLSCISGCADDETELVTDTNNHSGKKDQTCNGGLQSYCCSGFKPPPSKSDLAKQAADAAKDAVEAAAEQLALDVAAKAFCRIAVPALLAPLELVEDLIPIIGWIADAAEIAATPELIQLCVKGIEKEGKAEFKVFGKKHTISMETKTKPVSSRAAPSSHSPLPTSSANCKRADAPDNCGKPVRYGPDSSVCTASTTYEPAPVVSVCTGSRWKQACLHYSSVIDHHPEWKTLKCPIHTYWRPLRPWADQWDQDHNEEWYDGFMQSANVNCQPDEYPPAAFMQFQGRENSPKQYIRFAPGSQNGGAGSSLFRLRFCGYDDHGDLPVEKVGVSHIKDINKGGYKIRIMHYSARTTRKAVRIDFDNGVVGPAGDQYGLTANPCWPSTLLYDPGFALLTDDEYYDAHKDAQAYARRNYKGLIPQDVLGNHQPRPGYTKRDRKAHDLDPNAWVFDDGNSTRRVTDEELREDLGILRCSSADCQEEMKVLGIETARVVQPDEPGYHQVQTAVASTTQTVLKAAVTPVSSATASSGPRGTPAQPRVTGL